jgi:hypothetical protein
MSALETEMNEVSRTLLDKEACGFRYPHSTPGSMGSFESHSKCWWQFQRRPTVARGRDVCFVMRYVIESSSCSTKLGSISNCIAIGYLDVMRLVARPMGLMLTANRLEIEFAQ